MVRRSGRTRTARSNVHDLVRLSDAERLSHGDELIIRCSELLTVTDDLNVFGDVRPGFCFSVSIVVRSSTRSETNRRSRPVC